MSVPVLVKYAAPITSLALGAYAIHKVCSHKMTMAAGLRPANFSWVVDDVLAGSSYPEYPSHFQYYRAQGITRIISLTEWKPPMEIAPEGMTNLFMPIVEFDAPSLKQIQQFVDYVEDARDSKESCVVHCHWGRGRTGTMLAAYLVKHQNKHPRIAIEEIRRRRPYSVETYEQEAAVFEYAQYLKTKNADENDTH